MGELAKTGVEAGALSRYLQAGSLGSAALSKPFEQPIKLLQCKVAGTTLADGIDELVRGIAKGTRLELQRKPSDPFDVDAIAVLAPNGGQLGVIPSDVNEVPARLLEAGKELYAEVESIEDIDGWQKIVVNVYLVD